MRVTAPITSITSSQVASVSANHSRIAFDAARWNACREGTQVRILGQEELANGIDLVRCGKQIHIPDLDTIEGKWPFDDDEYFDS